jgi:hypothetical protein
VLRCGSKNGGPKNTCFKDIGVHAQILVSIIGSIVNLIEVDLYDHLIRKRIFTLMMTP